ncbi:SRPBCC family protein [Herbiconiux sp.]|uniref:SRPBCC family protein n=1 Tax=Herbiconiux sp. TaxID=1871186 RepID=UPI0025BCA29E|nr:SRPBCC family protein [Herbiconiux sp.]
MKPVVFTEVIDTAVSARRAFDRVVPRDDAELFTGYLVLPAVTRVSDQTGPWTTPGSRRTVHLSDGGTFREHLLRHTPPAEPSTTTPPAEPSPTTPPPEPDTTTPSAVGEFDYRVTDFTGALAHLVSEARASWRYEPTATGSRIRWTYEYVPLPRRRFVVERLIGPIWRRYMRRSLLVCARVAEGA